MKAPWAKKSDVPRRRQSGGDQTSSAPRSSQASGGNVFRRNRTLVGSLSTAVSSVNELSGDLRSPRTHVHHMKAHRRRLTSILTFILLGAGALVWLLYEFTAGIGISASDTGLVINQTRYQRAIGDYLNSHPTERLRALVNEKSLSDYMSMVTPEVSSVHVAGSAGIATTEFDIVFRRPVASWQINGKQYYVDKDGTSFQVNDYDKPVVKIVDNSGVPQATGATVASGRFLKFVGRAVELARNMGLVVDQAIIPAETTRQIDMRITGHKYPIKLSLDRPVGEQVEDMKHAVLYFDSHHLSPEYIDVRVSGKAFYR